MRNYLIYLRQLSLVLLAVIFLSSWSQAYTPEPSAAPFHDRFEVHYNSQGEVELITLKGGEKIFSLGPLLDEVERDFLFLKTFAIDAKEYFFPNEDERAMESWKREYTQLGRETIDYLSTFDHQSVLDHPRFRTFLAKFSDKIKSHLIGHNVLSSPLDYYYFQTRGFMEQVWEWGKSYIKTQFDDVPLVNVGLFVVDRAIQMVQERRLFYQFMLMHYLDRFRPEDLGMKDADVRRILSSIYSAKINWYNIFDTSKAKKGWMEYGWDKFSGIHNLGTAIVDMNCGDYDAAPERFNFAFANVVEGGQKKIVNLLNTRFLLSMKPSVAYYYGQPRRVELLRRFLRLVQIGSRFVPMTGLLRSGFNKFIQSMYVPQMRTEGALFGYLESHDMKFEVEEIRSQMINPYVFAGL